MKISMLFILFSVFAQDRTPLHEWLWKNRLIVVENNGSEDAAATVLDFGEAEEEMKERHMLLIELRGDEVIVGGKSSKLKAAEVRRYLEIEENTFEMLLIGKDGGIKLRSNSRLPAKTLFSLVDSMPMRQAEMGKD